MKKYFLYIQILISINASALVNLHEGSFQEHSVDQLEGLLPLVRNYHSRSLLNGYFGFGWCTVLNIFAEKDEDGGWLVNDCSRNEKTKLYDSMVYTTDDGLALHFNKDGLVNSIQTIDGRTFKLSYAQGTLYKIQTETKTYWIRTDSSKKIQEIRGPQGRGLRYSYNGDDLTGSITQSATSYHYDDLHNLIGINYSDGTTKQILYNKQTDTVLSLQGRNDCREEYIYQATGSDRSTTEVSKFCGGKMLKHNLVVFKTDKNRMINSVRALELPVRQLQSLEAWGLTQIQNDKALALKSAVQPVTIAIIDTGIDLTHPALKNHLWTNPGESGLDKNGQDKASNGIDDDDNGFVDDVHGWNFVNNNNKLSDRHGHGTHIAGIIKSVSPDAKLMVLKYMDPEFSQIDGLKTTIEAFKYAVQMNSRIVNYSAGGREKNPFEEAVIRLAQAKNILVVAAAGNFGANSDIQHFYPANYDVSNVLSVAAFDPKLKILSSSNYGLKTVDIAAPGEDIISTLPGGRYGLMSGTSQATAFATGVASLVIAASPTALSPQRVIKQLKDSGNKFGQFAGKVGSSKALNSYYALALKDRDLDAVGKLTSISKKINSQLYLSNPDSEPDRVPSQDSLR